MTPGIVCLSTVSHAQFVIDCHDIVSPPENTLTSFQAYYHGRFENESARLGRIEGLEHLPEGIVAGGLILYATSQLWPHEIHIQSDRSALFEKALFVLLGTKVSGLINQEILNGLVCNSGVGEAVFCRVSQAGFLRLLTQPKALGPDALDNERAWATFKLLRLDSRVDFSSERAPAELESQWGVIY